MAWSITLLGNDCGLRHGQLSNTAGIHDIPAKSGISQLDSSLYCHGDFVINVVRRTEGNDGSVKLDIKILNAGISDGVLEVVTPKGTTVKVRERYLLPGKRPISVSLAHHLKIAFDSENSLISDADPEHPFRWIRLSLILPKEGWLSLKKSGDLPAAASLVRIAAENIVDSKQNFIITPKEFWRISQRVGINAATMLRQHAIENPQASWSERADLSLTVINGLITSLMHSKNNSVVSSINGVFQLSPSEMETAYEMMAWPVDVSASYDFEATIDEFRGQQGMLVVQNDYEIPVTEVPLNLSGTWQGEVIAYPGRIKSGAVSDEAAYTQFKLEVDPTKNLYVTDYPKLGCMGILNVEPGARVNETYRFKEHLVKTSTKCSDGGYVNLLKMFGPDATSMMFHWENPATGANGIGGVIKRVSKIPDREIIKHAVNLQQIAVSTKQSNEQKNAVYTATPPVQPVDSPSHTSTALSGLENCWKAHEFAVLSQFVYQCDNPRCKQMPPAPWVMVDESRRISGFHAIAVKNINSGQLALVFEGTKLTSPRDWSNNIQQPFNKPPQYVDAVKFAKEVALAECDNKLSCISRIITTGHSLGGGLAHYVALLFGLESYIYNAAGLWGPTAGNIDTTIASRSKVTLFYSTGTRALDSQQSDIVAKHTGTQYIAEEYAVPVDLILFFPNPVDWMTLHSIGNLVEALDKSCAEANRPLSSLSPAMISLGFATDKLRRRANVSNGQISGLQALTANDRLRTTGRMPSRWTNAFTLTARVGPPKSISLPMVRCVN